MARLRPAWIGVLVLGLAACAHQALDTHTLASLRQVSPDTKEAPVEQGIDRAMQSYRQFLDQAPDSKLAPEAMRRLADLKIEKEYGIQGDGKLVDLPPASVSLTTQPPATVNAAKAGPASAGAKGKGAKSPPPPAIAKIDARASQSHGPATGTASGAVSTERDLEQRAAFEQLLVSSGIPASVALPDGLDAARQQAGPLEAIKLYDELLAKYPHYQFRDQVLYQKARAYDELGRTDESLKVMEQLVGENAGSRYADEVQFRRAEHFFVRRKYRDAESSYSAIVAMGPSSEYYELALYKLGWTLYKQELYDEALRQYFALLDYKVKSGYDFDAKHSEPEQRRVEDTFQVVSLSLSYLGGPEVIGQYFATNGHRGYEDRVYRYLAEFYRTKLRYHDAATVYKSFVALYPYHQVSPRFSMRVIEIYEQGGFPKLVLESKKDFASTYGLQAQYWTHFDVSKSPEVLAYLKSNLKDLANHYHAQYQDEKQREERPANYAEASRWYREFLSSFHGDPEAPKMDYQLADLMLENHDYALAAHEYERTAYEYAQHPKSAAAGYAAIYAHRESLKVVTAEEKDAARRETIASSLKFADTFPEHEQAAVVLAAAAEDAYELKDFVLAQSSGRHLLDKFPNAAGSVRRDAWLVVAHASFGLEQYADAEQAYTRVLEATQEAEASRPGLIENLAASIYKQGEQANQAGDYRSAANHFLRVKQVAPTSKICAAAEYDAGSALVRLQDWAAAAQVLDEFRRSFPDNELQKEATKQIAYAYQQAGQLAQSAGEYERVAKESPNPQLRAEAMLQAGDLYAQAKSPDRALEAYARFVEQFPKPIEAAEETRVKIAEIYKSKSDPTRYRHELEEIVRVDAAAGSERTDRTRNLAGRSALTLTEPVYEQFAALKLVLPFEKSLQEKQRAMDAAIKAFGKLVDYQVGEVTAAATFYMAEVYSNFSQSLRESQRPADLSGDALKDYDQQLEEAARPISDKAVAVHEKNLELMRRGVYNAWTQKSLDRLAAVKPETYARTEISSGFLGSLERYVYRPPPRSVETVAANTTPDAPAATAPEGAAVKALSGTDTAEADHAVTH